MGLIADIYKHGNVNCSSGGLSSRVEAVTLVNVSGPFDPTDDRPAAMVLPGAHPGIAKIVAAVEIAPGEYEPLKVDGSVGPMMGGCYVATSDSRFRQKVEEICGASFYGAVPLHDRYEEVTQR